MGFLDKLQGGTGEGEHIGPVELWRNVLLDFLNKNRSIFGPTRAHNFYASNQAMYSGKNKVSYLYSIDQFPGKLPISFTDGIRRQAQGKVRVSFVSTLEKTTIQWGSAKVKSRIRTWKSIEDESGPVDSFNYRDNIAGVDSADRRQMSLVYLSDAEIRRQRKLFRGRTLMIVSGDRGEDFDKTVDKILSVCLSQDIKISRVNRNIGDYLSVFSPFSLGVNPSVQKETGSFVLPDELVSRLRTYDQGKVGSKGIYMGLDIYSGFPVLKEIKRTEVDAENILITAETGGGKSFFAKGVILQLLCDVRFTGTIMDIEGDEYLPLASFTANQDSVVLLNMAEGQGSYFDPVEIIITGDVELDKDMFSLSRSYTLALFKTLVGKKVSDDDWADIIINDAVSKTYADVGVTLEKETWRRSAGLTLFSVYANLKELYKEISTDPDSVMRRSASGYGGMVEDDSVSVRSVTKYKDNEGYKNALDIVIARTSRYFETIQNGGSRSDVFSNRVTLEEIRDAKLVVCSFGMKGKSPATVDQTQMGMTQLYAANISHLRSIFSQSRGLYNFKVWEEFQRWGSFPDSEKTITTALTGGRKLGDVNLIITNKASELLTSDKFGIFENTTSFAIGAIPDAQVREQLCKRLSVMQLKPDLDRIVLENGSTESFNSKDSDLSTYKSDYDKAFLVYLDKQVATITRMELPPSIAQTNLFKTGISLVDQDAPVVTEGRHSFLDDVEHLSLESLGTGFLSREGL